METGLRLFGRIRILVDHAGMRTDALDSFPRGQFAGEKAMHASADKEGFFVLYVQAGEYGEIAASPVTHVSIVRIPGALSMRVTE